MSDQLLNERSWSDTGAWQIKDVRIALGGVAPFTQLAPKAAAAMRGQPWSQNTLHQTLQALSADIAQASESKGEHHMDRSLRDERQLLSVACYMVLA